MNIIKQIAIFIVDELRCYRIVGSYCSYNDIATSYAEWGAEHFITVKFSKSKIVNMKIACLGWGSLIWRPDNLLIRREWFADGPFLPIEFVRQSNDGRLTLVITKTANPIRTLWASMATDDLNVAKQSLKIREGVPNSKFESSISSITTVEETDDEIKLVIQEWAKSLKLDAVIWTSLPSKFREEDGQEPTLEEAILYLSSLDINKRMTAEEYIRRAPKQIDTEFRRRFESTFGWTFREL